MVENCNPISLSLPDDLQLFLEEESRELHVTKSFIVQEELYRRKKKKQNHINDQIALAFLLLVVGVTLWFFTMMIFPSETTISVYLPVFMGIGLLSIISGYIAFFLIYKKKRVLKI